MVDAGGQTSSCLHQVVEAQARHTPDAPAVVDGGRVLTYAMLDRRSEALARQLRDLGVGPEVPVVLCCLRSTEMAVGFLAILKAGGACVPLDPAHPPARLRFVIRDVDARVVLTQRPLAHLLASAPRPILFLDEQRGCDITTVTTAAASPSEQNLAYVLYTSGSTGRPKGVGLTHRGLVNHARAMSQLFALGSDDRVLQFASIAFDLSVEELFTTWLAGATLVLRPPDLPVLGPHWLDWLQTKAITVMDLPTGYWERWVQDLQASGERVSSALRLLVVGGEQPSAKAYARWLTVGGDRVRWLNTYGPTETSIVSTWYEGAGHTLDRLPIGRPIDNVTTWVLDQDMAPVATGAVGELYIGGVGVARGYLGRPGLTARSFVPDPFGADSTARLFKTGDLARRSEDGNLEFLGRVDHQLKVRGVRVEPGEVEHVLTRHGAIDQSAVVGHEDVGGELRLVAYCVAPGGLPAPAALRSHLGAVLPDQFVPSTFVAIDSLPLTTTGKVDHGMLPPPPTTRPRLGTPLVPPRTPTEAALAMVWSEVLELDEVGVDDNFFDLGGHSLLALQAVSRARELLGAELPASAVIEASTVAQLARMVESRPLVAATGDHGLVASERHGALDAPLSLQQEWMWALETKAEPQGLYNLTLHERFQGPVDVDALTEALRHLVDRHEALRTVFTAGDRPRARTLATLDLELVEADLTGMPSDERETELQRLLTEQNRQPFDLRCGPLLRARFYRFGPDEGGEVAVTCDHLVADGVSQGILLHELRAAHAATAEGRPPALRSLAVQYADYAVWQRRRVTPERLEAQAEFWKRKLAGMPLGPGIPFDVPSGHSTRYVRSRHLEVDRGTHARLATLAHESATSLFPLCVAAVQALIAIHSGRDDVVVSTMLSGRNRRELEGLVGLFAGAVRIRTDLSGSPSFRDLVCRVRAGLLKGLQHQDIPFGRVSEALVSDVERSGLGGLAEAMARPENLPVDVQYFPASWRTWEPGTAAMTRHPRHGAETCYLERGQRHPLMIDFYADRHEMWGTISYKTAYYSDAAIAELGHLLESLLERVTRDPDEALSGLLPDFPRRKAYPLIAGPTEEGAGSPNG